MTNPAKQLSDHQRMMIGQLRVNEVKRAITNLLEIRPLEYNEQQQLNIACELLKVLLVRVSD